MYDVVVIGQGLSGMLSAIWAKEKGFRTAVAASGTGRMLQASGVIDLIPGADRDWKEWMEFYQLDFTQKSQVLDAVEAFKEITGKAGYPYRGEIENLIPLVTGSGKIKKTALYPETISQVPETGHFVVVGFQEIVDFQPVFIKSNLQRERPHASIDAIKIRLGKGTQRTMTQLDAARLLDQIEIRNECIKQIKQQLTEMEINQADLFIFPASLGIENWEETIRQFSSELGAKVTEAPGMPPNATAIRLNDRLRKLAIKLGVRFYADTTVVGCILDGKGISALKIQTANRITNLFGSQFILATGGILGGGLELTPDGIKETALQLNVDPSGKIISCPENLYPVGAGQGMTMTHYGITGGMYAILSSYQTACELQHSLRGGIQSA
jgi:glycerol-3-phosphate dehydrogenase subunit B